jgi:CBS domain-containing protein
MRLAEVLDDCAVETVTVALQLSLAEAARSMHTVGAAAVLVMDNNLLQGILTAGDILRGLTSVSKADLVWNGPVGTAIIKELPIVTVEEKITQTIDMMTAAGIDYLPVNAEGAIRVVSLCRLLQVQNALLHGEVQHLQNYIDALHDAPND